MTNKAKSSHPMGRIPTQITVLPNQQSNMTKDALSVTSKEQLEFNFGSRMSKIDNRTPDAFGIQN